MKNTVLIFFIIFSANVFSQINIDNIYFDRRNVFDSTQSDWFFGAPIVNLLHIKTKPFIIEDELLFSEGSELDMDLIYETERNLRETGLFTNVNIEFDSAGPYSYDVYVVTQDKWSTQFNILFGTGGGEESYGAKIEEKNFLGTGSNIRLEALHRSENDIRWQGESAVSLRRIFRSDFALDFALFANRFRTEQALGFRMPYRNWASTDAFGIQARNLFGKDFIYRSDSINLLPFHERKLTAWYSHAWVRNDKVFFTVLAEFDDVNRSLPDFRRAYDNTAKILAAFSSLSESYYETSKLNTFLTEDLPIGGWGTTILGKTFAMSPGGEALYYIGGRGETSWMRGNLYLFGQLTGASAFTNNRGKYTYQEFLGLGFYRFTEDLLIAARLRQQTVWNWYAYRQLVLDNDGGLRGYSANRFAGENRIVGNIEVRAFPDVELWIFNFGPVLFFDTGTVWDRGIDLGKTRWHCSAGAGIRIFNTKASGNAGILRIDFAYNFDEKKFAEIIFTSDQLFKIFSKHDYNIPEIFGSEFDFE